MDAATRRLWIGIPGTALEEPARSLLLDVRPGGVVLFGHNVEDPEGVRRLVADLRGLLGADLRVAVDQEGGLVVRFPRGLTVFPGNMALGAASVREPSLGEHLARRQGVLGARELRDLGIDVNLAPVLDLATRGGNPGIGTRSFGEHAELAERLGRALVRGSLEGGVLPTLKHFPGKGEAVVDAHLDLPVIETGDQELHLRPFRSLVEDGAPLVMSSHVVYRALDADRPATLSPAVARDLLRGRFGFAGVLVTDDLEMGAMARHYAFDDVVRGASAAGHDVLCICHDPDRQRRAAALLRRGLGEREAWFGDPEEVGARLERLVPAPPGGPPDPAEGPSVAEAVAGRAVTVVRDHGGLLPLGPDHRCCLVLPEVRAETGVEDPLRGEDPAALADLLPGAVRVLRVPLAPAAEDVGRVLAAARGSDRLLLATTLARFQHGQASLVHAALAEHPAVVLLPLRNPFDLEVVPEDARCAAVTAYGFRPVHLAALAAVLCGRNVPYGRLPVTLRSGAGP